MIGESFWTKSVKIIHSSKGNVSQFYCKEKQNLDFPVVKPAKDKRILKFILIFYKNKCNRVDK